MLKYCCMAYSDLPSLYYEVYSQEANTTFKLLFFLAFTFIFLNNFFLLPFMDFFQYFYFVE